jgi:hypothetical protein
MRNFSNNTWGTIGDIITLIFEERLENNEMNFMILYHSRHGKTIQFKDTMGLFLDLIPVKIIKNTEESMNCQIMTCIRRFKELKDETILNTLDFYNNRSDYPEGIDMIIKSIITVNYLGMFELEINQYSNKIQKMDLELNHESNALIISLSNSYLNIGMFNTEEGANGISQCIIKYFALKN